MKRAVQKLNRNTGFTLAEVLITVLILLMVTGIVAAGIPAAANAYNKAIDAANAHALLSTAVSALRDKLSTAQNVEFINGAIVFLDADTGGRSKIYIKDGVIWVQDYLRHDDPNAEAVQKDSINGEEYPAYELVSKTAKKAQKKNLILIIEYSSVDWDDPAKKEVIKFTGLVVKKGNTEIVKLDEFYIRLLRPGA